MKQYFERLLKTYDYSGYSDFFTSLAPSFKHQMVLITFSFSGLSTLVNVVFGWDALAFIGFCVIMVTELVSGIWASALRKEQFSSLRLSRFGFKLFYYLVLMGVPYVFAESYRSHHKDLAASVFDWLHIFLTIHIIGENIISILENGSVINGGDKADWINAIKTKINSVLS